MRDEVRGAKEGKKVEFTFYYDDGILRILPGNANNSIE
jgi:hypothetical protein